MKYTELRKRGYRLHHDAFARGYISRKLTEEDYPVEEYCGKFGSGYKAKLPSWKTSNYCVVEYWIK